MKKFLAIAVLFLAGTAFGQAASTPTPGADLPSQTFGVFASYDAYNTPHVTGGFEVSKLATTLPYETITSIYTSFRPLAKPRGAIATSVALEVDQVVSHAGPFHFLAIGSAGVSTTSTTTGGVFQGGGGFIYTLPANKQKFFDSVKFKAVAEHSAAAGTLGAYFVTFQKGFGK
jgi:hypothetical protein